MKKHLPVIKVCGAMAVVALFLLLVFILSPTAIGME